MADVWTSIPDRTTSDNYSATDFNAHSQAIRILGGDGSTEPASDITDLDTRVTAIEGNLAFDVSVKTANYTVLDDDGIGIIACNSTSGAFTVTLPTLADNQERQLRIIVTHVGGAVTVDGEGAETISGRSSIYLQGQYDILHIVGTSTEWSILSLRSTFSTGGINTNDWTNRHLGCAVCEYDNLSGSFTVGETITEEISSNTGVIVSDSGTLLVLKDVTGTGIFTDNREITGGTSGATADVNYPASSSKNVDSNVTHGFDTSVTNLMIELWLYEGTTFDDATAKKISDTYADGGSACGTIFWGVDADNFQVQTGATRSFSLTVAGAVQDIDNDDYSYKVIAREII